MSTTAKRKIQELVRNGKLQDAVEVLRQATGESDADPYDHVYLGDLLMRLGETEDSLASYQRAIRSYEAVGLNRNAIAIGKKLLRIDPARAEVHRGLAQLYEREGLASEALPHFLAFLDSFSGEQVPPTEFLEALDQAASLAGARVEVALRLVEHFQRIRRTGRAAELLSDVASHAERAGSPEIAADLRQRAREMERLEPSDGADTEALPLDGASLAPAIATSERYELSDDRDDPAPPTVYEDEPGEQAPAIGASALDAIGSALAEAVEELNSASGLSDTGRVESAKKDAEAFGDLFDNNGIRSFAAPDTKETSPGQSSFIVEHFPSAGGDTLPSPEDTFASDDERDGDGIDALTPQSRRIADAFAPAAGKPSGGLADTLDEEPLAPATRARDAIAPDAPVDAFTTPADDADPIERRKSDAFSIGAPPARATGDAFALPGTLASRKDEDDAEPVWEIVDETIEPLDLRPIDEDDDSDARPAPILDTEEEAEVPFASEEVESLAESAYLAHSYAEARRLYESLPHERLENRKVLAKLVDAVHHLGDSISEAMYLCRLGDAWIADNEYEEALDCFLRVLSLDPKNVNAQRRLAKFRELGIRGAEGIRESDSHSLPGILETGRTEVAVKSGEEFRSEDWIELSGLLEEFKSGLKNQMDASDHQAHYDLAVSHHSMGLLDEALEELEIALGNPALPPDLERRARELKASCLMELQRFREAVHELREVADRAGADRAARRAALYNLGRALESVEEWQEASETYLRLKVEAPGFLDLEDRIRECEQHLTRGGDVSGLTAA